MSRFPLTGSSNSATDAAPIDQGYAHSVLDPIEDGSGDHPLFVPVELGCMGPGGTAPIVLLTGAD